MTAISTSPVVLENMSFSPDENDRSDGPFPLATDAEAYQSLSTTAEQPSPRAPLPLPTFVFPARASPPSLSPRSAPSSFSRASGRRPKSAIELTGGPVERSSETEGENSRAKLPDFSFGGQSQLQSPPLSPQSLQTMNMPTRPGFHKRGTSEFIGGDGKTGNGMGLMSTSPTKGDNFLPHPNPSAFGPPPGRRGHAHRRSAAISCHDLTMILKPDPSIPRGGSSAPTSPAGDLPHQTPPFPGSLDFKVQANDKEEDLDINSATTPPLRAFNRNRVGFSDTVDIIPRPLSLVSSDSASTVRQGHSVTGSMSSIVSAGTSSPQAKDKRSLPLSPTQMATDTRPKTADPVTIIDRESSQSPDPRRRNSIPLLMEAAASASPNPSTPRSAKKWTLFGHETGSGETSPKSRPTSAASSKEPRSPPAETAPSNRDVSKADVPIQSAEPSSSRRSSITRKPSKKQKKVRSWAGSILSRKSRPRGKKQKLSRRCPTPPLRAYTPVDDIPSFEFKQSERVTLPKPELNTDIASWKPRKLPPPEESMSPIIDLDAALGPFNTPSSFGDDWDVSQRGGTRKRAMHSAAGLGGFSGPGMHYHRRAESAPEFENPRFGLHRLGSSSTMGMEDVFEEENEDEEWEDTKASSDKAPSTKTTEDEEETGLGIDIKVVDSEGMQSDKSMDFDEATFQRGVKRKGSGLSEGDRRHVSSSKSEHSGTSVIDEPIVEEDTSPVEIHDDSIPPRPDSGAKSSDSTATPPLKFKPAKELAPVDIQPFALQPPYATPTSPHSTTQSSFPSPRSPFSYDAQRISTAPSSVTDEQGFQSLLLGEPGPEVRMSVDDVPSLTSSNSTMTRDSNIPVATRGAQFQEGRRSASLSTDAITRKRSSMASLSRLISSSHGERSKLSIETRPSTSEGESKEKTSKSKRISRMMQFWKPKDSS